MVSAVFHTLSAVAGVSALTDDAFRIAPSSRQQLESSPACCSAWRPLGGGGVEVDRSHETVCFPCRGCERGSGGSRGKLLRVGAGGK